MANYQLEQTGAEVQALLNAVESPDTTPAAGSSNLITSGAVQAAVAGVSAEVTALGKKVKYIDTENIEDLDEEIIVESGAGKRVAKISIGESYGEEEQIWSNDDGSDTFAKIGEYGIKAKAYLDLDGNPVLGLPGKSILWLGDSIMLGVGSSVGKSCVDFATRRLGCVSYNGGIGGRYYRSGTGITTDGSFIDVAEAIISGDWSKVDNGIEDIYERVPTPIFATIVPSYAVIRALDFSELDYLFINYGTNDWASNVILNNPSDPEDTTTALGALRKGLRILMTDYPQLRVYAASPLYRSDAETPNSAGYTLKTYAEQIKLCFASFGVPCFDAYENMGVNANNYTYWYADGVHPNEKGAELLGEKYAKFLLNI